MLIVVKLLSRIWLFVTPWTVAHQAPLSVGFPKQEYWSELLFHSTGESSWPRDQTHVSFLLSRLFTTEPPGKPQITCVDLSKMPSITLGLVIVSLSFLLFYGVFPGLSSKSVVHMYAYTHLYILNDLTVKLVNGINTCMKKHDSNSWLL